MVNVLKRLCIKDYTITDKEGTSFTIESGKSYTTTLATTEGEVTVFSRFWIKVPITIFATEEPNDYY